MVKTDWRKCHDYSGDNDRQECRKCGRVLLSKDQHFPPSRSWKDKEPVCPVEDTHSLKELFHAKTWYYLPPKTQFYISVRPYTDLIVRLEDLL